MDISQMTITTNLISREEWLRNYNDPTFLLEREVKNNINTYDYIPWHFIYKYLTLNYPNIVFSYTDPKGFLGSSGFFIKGRLVDIDKKVVTPDFFYPIQDNSNNMLYSILEKDTNTKTLAYVDKSGKETFKFKKGLDTFEINNNIARLAPKLVGIYLGYGFRLFTREGLTSKDRPTEPPITSLLENILKLDRHLRENYGIVNELKVSYVNNCVELQSIYEELNKQYQKIKK